MPIIVKIFTAILPYILNYIDKHSDDILDRVYAWVGNKLGVDEVATIKFKLVDKDGNAINNAIAKFNYDILGELFKKSIKSGEIIISGFKEGKVAFTIDADGFKSVDIDIEFKSNSDIVEKIIVMEDGIIP